MRFTDEVADRAGASGRPEAPFAEVEQRVDRAPVAHLVVETGEHDVVAFAAGAVRPDQATRHDEQRDPLHAGRPARDPRQHQVHDVLGDLVLAGRDPHLVAGQAVLRAERRIAVRLGTRRDVGERRTGLRLRQAHGAGEASLELRPRERSHLRRGYRGRAAGWRSRWSAKDSPHCRRSRHRSRRSRPCRPRRATACRRTRNPARPRAGRPRRTPRRPRASPESSGRVRRRTRAPPRRSCDGAAGTARWRCARQCRAPHRRCRVSDRHTAGGRRATSRRATRTAGIRRRAARVAWKSSGHHTDCGTAGTMA